MILQSQTLCSISLSYCHFWTDVSWYYRAIFIKSAEKRATFLVFQSIVHTHLQAIADISEIPQALGISLLWRSASEGVNVKLNLCVTLLNREYFGENRSFMIKKATFDHEHLSNGNGSFIKIADLLTHRPRFTDSNGEFQVKNTKAASAFHAKICLTRDTIRRINIRPITIK